MPISFLKLTCLKLSSCSLKPPPPTTCFTAALFFWFLWPKPIKFIHTSLPSLTCHIRSINKSSWLCFLNYIQNPSSSHHFPCHCLGVPLWTTVSSAWLGTVAPAPHPCHLFSIQQPWEPLSILLSTLQWPPVSPRVKAKVLSGPCMIDMPPVPQRGLSDNLTPIQPHWLLSVPERARQVSTSGLLYLVFCLPGMFLP